MLGVNDKDSDFDETIEFFCDEAQLPNVNTATGTQNGLYLGSGSIDYPHTRIFTEIQLGFMLDSNLSILKFLNNWYGTIFSGDDLDYVRLDERAPSENRITRLRYRDEYASTIRITKSEMGPNSTTQRRPITYVLEKAYPYAIDAIPLQFGSSQVTKVTAQFKYQRHYTIQRDVSGLKGSVSGLPKRDTVTGSSQLVQRGPDGNLVTWPKLTPPPALPSSPSQIQDPRARAQALGT
jgi:hypothetical protein